MLSAAQQLTTDESPLFRHCVENFLRRKSMRLVNAAVATVMLRSKKRVTPSFLKFSRGVSLRKSLLTSNVTKMISLQIPCKDYIRLFGLGCVAAWSSLITLL